MLPDQVSYRAVDRNPVVSCGFGPRFRIGSTDHAFGDETFQKRGRVDSEEARNGYPAFSHENLLAGSGTIDPLAEIGSEGAHRNIHDL